MVGVSASSARRIRASLAILVCALAVCVVAGSNQQHPWDEVMAAAGKAYQDRNFPEAEKLYSEALHQAEDFGPTGQVHRSRATF